jgi:uncharacterized protein (TIGR02594 family)
MQEIIDVASDVTDFASGLANAGVKTVIRYYNNNNTSSHPSKLLTQRELNALHDAGLSVAVVFEQRGGATGDISDLTKETGDRDAQQALDLATERKQPEGSAIYFAVDFDFIKSPDLQHITDYFREVRRVFTGKYLVGVYGSGKVGQHLKETDPPKGLVDHIWLSASTGFAGTEQALREGNFTLFQRDFDKRSPIGGFNFDGNILNSSFENFGQFGAGGVQDTPLGVGAAALFKVIARSGLHLRAGPGDNFQVLDTVPVDTIVTGIGRDGGWLKVDLEGDGQADGFMFEHFLQAVSGGLPLDPGSGGPPLATRQPIDVARAEMNLGVAEIPGPKSNPRIVLYHSTTQGKPAGDETPWCSSFVNFCVEQVPALGRGTDSRAAKSWDEQHWHHEVTTSPREGDIVAFQRGSGDGGHVGFFISQSETHIQVLGGNQQNAINVSSFPIDGVSGGTHYKLLSIRRG